MSEFKARDEYLKLFKFSSYEEYLASDLWAWIRERLMASAGAAKCRCCKSTTGLVWHHTSYEPHVLVGNFSVSEEAVVRVCSRCHSLIHFDSSGALVTLEQSRQRLQAMHDYCLDLGDDGATRPELDKLTGRHPEFDEFQAP